MTHPNLTDYTAQDHWQAAQDAHRLGHTSHVAAHAATLAVHHTSHIIELIHTLDEHLADAATPNWQRWETPTTTPFHCLCGDTGFAPYPLRAEYALHWWVCGNADCDVIWSYEHRDGQEPMHVSGGPDEHRNDPPWNIHDLVRHRSGVGQHNGGFSTAEYVAMLQSRDADDPAWWNAQVVRVVNPPAHTSPPLLGQGVHLREGSMNNRVAIFP